MEYTLWKAETGKSWEFVDDATKLRTVEKLAIELENQGYACKIIENNSKTIYQTAD